ncbi:MAG: hypothetical protein BroJett026_06370 [Betaproteobacteria bacterium]|nr:MAG: hypothetical protein BroJett026_06370 [Betaproteobacteria bacterium]
MHRTHGRGAGGRAFARDGDRLAGEVPRGLPARGRRRVGPVDDQEPGRVLEAEALVAAARLPVARRAQAGISRALMR